MQISIDLINSIGVAMILSAFFLLSFKYVRQESLAYLLLNIAGSALACLGAYLLHSIPFMILEATWCAVSLITLFKIKVAGKGIK